MFEVPISVPPSVPFIMLFCGVGLALFGSSLLFLLERAHRDYSDES